MERILSEVETLMDFGAGRSAIIQAMPELPPRTVDEYMRRALDRAEEENEALRSSRRARALRRNYGYLRQLAADREAFLEGDSQRGIAKEPGRVVGVDHAIRGVETHIAKLEGTFTPQEVKIIKKQGWEDLKDDEIDNIIATGILPDGMTIEDLRRRN